MSLLTVCQDALQRLTGFEVPSNYFGNTNLTAVACVALVKAEGRALVREHRWDSLVTSYTFTTVSGTDTYDLPADFMAFGNRSQFDRMNTRRLAGPTSPSDWQELKSTVIGSTGLVRFFRKVGSTIVIHPVPSATGDTLAFDYYSKNWVVDVASVAYDAPTADNNTFRLDEELLTLGLKWRFLQAKGLPFEPEYKEYEAIKEEVRADAGAGAINLNPMPNDFRFGENLPDTGIGQ